MQIFQYMLPAIKKKKKEWVVILIHLENIILL